MSAADGITESSTAVGVGDNTESKAIDNAGFLLAAELLV